MKDQVISMVQEAATVRIADYFSLNDSDPSITQPTTSKERALFIVEETESLGYITVIETESRISFESFKHNHKIELLLS